MKFIKQTNIHPLKRRTKSISTIILFLLSILLLSNLHIEFLWFKQLNFESVLLKRLFLQFITFLSSIFVSIIYIFWIKKWIRFNTSLPTSEKKITGWIYGTALFTSIVFINITIYILFSISIDVLSDPYKPYNFWKYLNQFKPNLTNFLPLSILNTILIANLKRGFQYIQILGCFLFVVITTRSWAIWALAFSIPQSGSIEPLFASDVSFALARYPAFNFILTLILLLTLLTLSSSIWWYLTTKSCLSDWSAPWLNNYKRNYLRPIIALLFFDVFLLFWLSRHEFMWSDSGIIPGAGWLDIYFNIPLRNFSCFCVLTLLFLSIPFKFRHKNLIRFASSILFTLSIISEILFTPLLEWILVRPKELILEEPYISRSIKATRKAFQLDSIKTKLINPQARLTSKDLVLGESTLRNVRLWDSQPLLDTNRQLQQLRQYYRFSNVAVDRYRLKSDSVERQQVMITAREIDQDQLPKSSKTWLTKHFVFTHGYGFTVSPINTKADDGLPEYFIKDLGPSTSIDGSKTLGITKKDVITSLPIGKPSIYYGMLTSTYAIAPSQIKELDYPQGDKNIFNHYKGKGGISLNTLLQRISASIHLKEPRILNSGSLNYNSKLLLRREIKKRIKTIAPFIDLIGDPYLISINIHNPKEPYQKDQNQYWIVEGYTSSEHYPYASLLPDGRPIRYIRNSVKAVIDSYNGSVMLYISEPNDPLIRAWQSLFPNLFQPLTSMPLEIREHLRVPKELFNMQVQQLLRYHVTDPTTFYNGDDLWQVPKELYGTKEVPVEPYHITAQLGDNEESEFLLLQPLSPLARPNLAAWLAARNDSNNYGQLVLLKFPSQTSIFGPEQIQALINQNPSISQQFSLWDRAGSEVIQGNLLVLPIGQALLYVEPVYLKATMGGLPTLTRIVVSDGKRIAMAETLTEGIRQLLNQFKVNK